jgi:hypothetical protein
MRTHILTALMALFIAACASHHRDVASVQDEESRTDQAFFQGVTGGGGNIR